MEERESIFWSAFRSFCKAIASGLGLLVILMPVLAMVMLRTLGPLMQEGGEHIRPVLLQNETGKQAPFNEKDPVILALEIEGEIGSQWINSDTVDSAFMSIGSGLLGRADIKGLLLVVSSPGGAAIDSAHIYRAILKFKEQHKIPVYVHVDGFCASGALYISCAADKIYATPDSAIGSIGVIWNFPNVSGLMEKAGVAVTPIHRPDNKGMMAPTQPLKPGDADYVQALVDDSYENFVAVVAKGRNLEPDFIKTTLQAGVFSTKRSVELKLVDASSGSMEETLKALAAKAGVSHYQLVALRYQPGFQGILGQMSAPLGLEPVSKLLKPLSMTQPCYLYEAALSH